MTEIYTASRQWANRPDDQRFLSVEDWNAEAQRQRTQSREATSYSIRMQVAVDEERNDLYIASSELNDPDFTHYSFGQLARLVGAPAGYLRTLPTMLAGAALQYGMEHHPFGVKAYLNESPDTGNHVLAMTSHGYGRVYDAEVTEQVLMMNQDGRWQIPAATYASTNPLLASTLYKSDHDMFGFLVDPNNPIEMNGETLFRGFMVWNSEVGAATLGVQMFLYRRVCDNRIVWGAQDVKTITMRHSKYAPSRFAREVAPMLSVYAESTTKGTVAAIKAAKKITVGSNTEEVEDWLKAKGFAVNVAKKSVVKASEEGDPKTLWNVVQGITAYARDITHTDTRVDLERKAGALMTLAEKAA